VRQDVNKRRQQVLAGTKTQFIRCQCRDFDLTSEKNATILPSGQRRKFVGITKGARKTGERGRGGEEDVDEKL